MVRLSCSLVAAVCIWGSTSVIAQAPAVASPSRFGKIELIRDQWGIPHVFAETDAGAMYGLGYATAADRAFQMVHSLRIIQGRLAETVGDVKHVRRRETALHNDRKMRTFGFYRAAKKVAENLDADTRELLQAYCDGVNDYIAANPRKLHPLFGKLGVKPERWTVADCIASWWHMGQFFATDGTRDLIRYRNLAEGGPRRGAAMRGRRGGRGARGRGGAARTRPAVELRPLGPDDAAAVVARSDVSDEWVRKVNEFARKHGIGGPRERPADAGPQSFAVLRVSHQG